MSWASAVPKNTERPQRKSARQTSNRPSFTPPVVDWSKLVTLDFETYYDQDYTLKKLTTSEYIRDPRFEAQMLGLKIGNKPTRIVHGRDIAKELGRIDWSTHSVLCHHTQFDGLILSHHYGVIPKFYYCTLSMARGWLANDIGAGLDEVDRFFGGGGKVGGGDALISMRGIRLKDMHPDVYRRGAEYCIGDTDKCFTRFKDNLLVEFSQDELDLIDATCQMFCCPTLVLDEPRARAAMEKEIAKREELLLSVSRGGQVLTDLTSAHRRELLAKIPSPTPRDIQLFSAIKVIGSSEQFAELLRAEGVEPPLKISKSWIDTPPDERTDDKKYGYAFAKDDLAMQELLNEHPSERVRDLCETRLAVKSNITVTRAGRLLESGKNGRAMPVYYKYAGAHTWRFSGGDGQNWQNFTRGGELRLSIKAPEGYVLAVADSSQIEARTNAWLWGQTDLIEAFRRGEDIYSLFATENIYGRLITKKEVSERHVGKTAILGLGFQMGATKFRNTLARGVGGPPVFIDDATARSIVNAYRRRYYKIKQGWGICEKIIEDMATGRQGEYKCLRWEAETIWLPNGMRLKYPNLRKNASNEWVYDRKGITIKLYGGLLCENIVQALARIIVAADQLLNISKLYPVVMTTHDEVVTCIKTNRYDPPQFSFKSAADIAKLDKRGTASQAIAHMYKTMSTPPAWCADIPLSAEGGFDLLYSK